jgi:hypothetical protein
LSGQPFNASQYGEKMTSSGDENNVVQFEARQKISLSHQEQATSADLKEPTDMSGCQDGVCVLAWKPRRPTAAA